MLLRRSSDWRLSMLAYRQKRSVALRFWGFNPHGTIFVDAHHVGDPARVVPIRLVSEPRAQGCSGMGRIDDDHRHTPFAQSSGNQADVGPASNPTLSTSAI